MQPNQVELPPEELIEPGLLIKAIIKALYPEKTEGLKGMECIEGKLVQITANRNKPLYPDKTAGFIALDLTKGKPVLITADPNSENYRFDFGAESDSCSLFSHDEAAELPPQPDLPIEQPQYTQDLLSNVVEDDKNVMFRLPYALTDEDRKELEPLLDKLPPLEYPMTENAISKFLDAYMALPERPSWVPTIITWETISRRLEEQNAAVEGHKAAIRQAIEEGKLSACDKKRVPARFLTIGTLIPRSSAVDYLTQCGLSQKEEVHPATEIESKENAQEGVITALVDYLTQCGVSPKEELHPAVEDIENEADRPEGVYTASGLHVYNKKNTGEKWTAEEKAAIEAKLSSIDLKTNKQYTLKKVAELLGLKSAARLTQILGPRKARPKVTPTPWSTGLSQMKGGVNKNR